MSAQRTVLIVGAFRFPNGDAAAARVLSVGKALRAAGNRVVFAGWEAAPRSSDLCEDGISRYEDFEYYSQSEFRTENMALGKRLFHYLFAGRRTLDWIARFGLRAGDGVIAYHGRAIFLWRLLRQCRRASVDLLFDCTEWYAPENLIGGRFGVAAIEDHIRMTVVNRLVGRGLVISRYLERYYSDRGLNILRVPPLVDVMDSKWSACEGSTAASTRCGLVLAYAGVPGKKDLVSSVLEALVSARSKGLDVRLELIGPVRDDLVQIDHRIDGWMRKLGDAVTFHGRIPQDAVPALLRRAHFTVLLRPEARVSEAGFPTKVVESLAAGLPIICNLSSDIGMYLKDGVHGVVATDSTSAAVEAAIFKASRTSQAERQRMGAAAMSLASDCFDYRVFVTSLSAHLSSSGNVSALSCHEGADA